MITKKEYIAAKKIVEGYESQLKAKDIITMSTYRKFRQGQRVTTNKGCRITKERVDGIVIGYSKWRDYPSVKIKKDNGKIVMCLSKNLIIVK